MVLIKEECIQKWCSGVVDCSLHLMYYLNLFWLRSPLSRAFLIGMFTSTDSECHRKVCCVSLHHRHVRRTIRANLRLQDHDVARLTARGG